MPEQAEDDDEFDLADIPNLTGQIELESHAIEGGGFGDIYRGIYVGKPVAIKVFRTYALEPGDTQRAVMTHLRGAPGR